MSTSARATTTPDAPTSTAPAFLNIQATGEATNAVVTGMLTALLDHIDELEADLKASIALGKAYAVSNGTRGTP